MANIIGVGIAAVDIVNITSGYPEEDQEVRAVAHSMRRGGNITNTLVVLSQLGHHCQWLGTMADDVNSQVIIDDLVTHGIDYSHCPRMVDSTSPTSYITLNQNNGSRTIVHYRDLPELSDEYFHELPLTEVDWIHFEGRNCPATRAMINRVRQQSRTIPLSVEIEKPRDQLELLFDTADCYFFSRAFAHTQQFATAEELLCHFRSLNPNALLICTWGADGAYAMDGDKLIHVAAVHIDKVVDSIGAGDTFIAGFIDAQLKSSNIDTALQFACQLASHKCTMQGFTNLTKPA